MPLKDGYLNFPFLRFTTGKGCSRRAAALIKTQILGVHT